MFDIFKTNGNSVELNSGLGEMMFAKTKSSRFLEENSVLVSKDKNGNFNTFSTWTFAHTKTEKEEVYFVGTGFSGVSISRILLEKDKEKIKQAMYALVDAYTNAIIKGVKLPQNGPAGILYNEESLLFAPEQAFDRSTANRGKKFYEEIQGIWLDSEGDGHDRFFRSFCAYYALTFTSPYNSNGEKRSIDIFYKNFTPLEYAVNGIDKNLAKAVNLDLSHKKQNFPFPLEIFKQELFLEKKRTPEFSEEEFLERKIKNEEQRNKKIALKRMFSKYKIIALIAAAAAIFLVLFLNLIFSENLKKPTVIGLTAKETVEVFYKGIHTMDTDLILASAKYCPQAQRYISVIPQLFITGQLRSLMSLEAGISTPENWMFFEPDTMKAYLHYVYGITNFTIEEEPTLLEIIPPTADKPLKTKKIDSEGKRLSNTSKEVYNVHYYLVHHEDDYLNIEFYNTKVILLWMSKKWQITTLEEQSSSQIVLPKDFQQELKNTIEKYGDVLKSVDYLKTKYEWLPTKEAMQKEKDRLDGRGY